jgi:hypothetical protein
MRRERRTSRGQAVAGLLLLTVGSLLFAQNLGLYEVRQFWRYWPVLPLTIGVVKLFTGQSRNDQAIGIFLTCLGAGQLAKVLGYWSPGPADIVAVILIVFGGVMIGRGVFGRLEPSVTNASSDSISAVAVLAGFERSNNSQDFRGGDLTAVMGGCEIDLRRASMRAPASIDVFVMWGGVEVRVPDDWTVDLQGTPVLAGFVDKTRPPALATEKRLIIRGLAIMGGVEIKN